MKKYFCMLLTLLLLMAMIATHGGSEENCVSNRILKRDRFSTPKILTLPSPCQYYKTNDTAPGL